MSQLHWREWFHRSHEPFFVLNSRRRILFVNSAWETLAGVATERARHLTCRRRRIADDAGWEAFLEYALSPPEEVLEGHARSVVRILPHSDPSRRLWRIDFLPLRNEEGLLLLLGRITATPLPGTPPGPSLTPATVLLRQEAVRHYTLESLASPLPTMARIVEQVRFAAPLPIPVALVGERGSGKRWIGRVLHARSPLADRAFVTLDCARLPDVAFQNVLFGDSREGMLVEGTLYLREPSCLPRELQLRLCAALGGTERHQGSGALSLPRLVTSSVRDLTEEVRAGRLLEELACRLSPVTILVPPLRERPSDLTILTTTLLRRATEAAGRPVMQIAPTVWDLFRNHTWPGNLTELYRVLVAAAVRATGNEIQSQDLPFYLRASLGAPPPLRPLPLKVLLEETERRLIALALRKTGGNKTRTAELLSIWRPLLLRRMTALGLAPPSPKNEDETEEPKEG